MEKSLFSIRKAGRQGGRARGGSASLPADGSEVAEVALPAFQFCLSASDGSKVARWLSDPSGRQGGSEVALPADGSEVAGRYSCLADGCKVAEVPEVALPSC